MAANVWVVYKDDTCDICRKVATEKRPVISVLVSRIEAGHREKDFIRFHMKCLEREIAKVQALIQKGDKNNGNSG